MALTRVFLGVVGLAITGCSLLTQVVPATACDASAREYGGPVVGAFATTIAGLRRVELRDGQPGRWADLPPDHPAVVCYIDAEIPKAPPPGPNGELPDPYDRIVVAVVDGEAILLQAGYRNALPIEAP